MRLPHALLATVAVMALAAAAIYTISVGSVTLAAQETGASDVAVEMQDYSFTPRHIVVRQNEPVRFVVTNTGAAGARPHQMEIAGQGKTWSSARYEAGDSASFTATFSDPGAYRVWCSIGSHRDQGMVGTLTVVAESETPVSTTQVELTEFTIHPLTATTVASPNARLEVSNTGRFPHNLVIDGLGTKVGTDNILPGEMSTWETSLLRAGTYELYCSIVVGTFDHRDLGMIGLLEVLPAASPPM